MYTKYTLSGRGDQKPLAPLERMRYNNLRARNALDRPFLILRITLPGSGSLFFRSPAPLWAGLGAQERSVDPLSPALVTRTGGLLKQASFPSLEGGEGASILPIYGRSSVNIHDKQHDNCHHGDPQQIKDDFRQEKANLNPDHHLPLLPGWTGARPFPSPEAACAPTGSSPAFASPSPSWRP